MTVVTPRSDFEKLMDLRLKEAKLLLEHKDWDGAYFLAGYAVEFALKIRIIAQLMKSKIDDGRRFVERFAADGNPVDAAFWVKTAEEGLWFLYVVTELIDREGPAAAYRAVHASLGKLDESWVSSSEIKVVSPNNPMAKDVLAIMARHPGRLVTRYGAKTLGSVAVEQMYIYPTHVFTFTQANPMTTEDVSREVVRLMNRGPGIVQPSRVTLKDGTTFNGMPFSISFGSQNAVVVSFIVDGEVAPRVVRLDEIASIV